MGMRDREGLACAPVQSHRRQCSQHCVPAAHIIQPQLWRVQACEWRNSVMLQMCEPKLPSASVCQHALMAALSGRRD